MSIPDVRLSEWFQAEVKPHEATLKGFLRTRVPQGVEVDDVLQETYARVVAFKARKDIESSRGLLFAVARNVVRDLLRKKYASKTISLGEIDVNNVIDICEVADEAAEQVDRFEALQSALRSLPVKCRAVVILRYFDKLSYKEIAERLGISVKTVEKQLARGLKKCRGFFGDRGILDEM